MPDVAIVAKKRMGDEEREATITFDFGENLEEAVEMFGEDVVFSNFRAAAKITAQAAMRRYIESGLNAEQIGDKMAMWKPGVALERVIDPIKALLAKWGTMDEEAKKDLLTKLKAAS